MRKEPRFPLLVFFLASTTVVQIACTACGRRPRFSHRTGYRIIGGRTTLPGEVPWQVLIKYSRVLTGEQCGGSIIDARWIVTAGHCVFPDSPYSVATGVTLISDAGWRNRGRNPHVQEHRVIKTIPFGDYRKDDIALLKLATPIRFDDYSQPVCLPVWNESFERSVCTASGWGVIDKVTKDISRILKAVDLPVISLRYCNKLARKLNPRIKFQSNFMCTLYPMGGRGTCSGDSGGPLACLMNNGKYLLAGLTSQGIICGDRRSPAVFSKLHYYIPWIRNVTGLNF